MVVGDDLDDPLPEELLSGFEDEPPPRPAGQVDTDLQTAQPPAGC